MRTFLSKVRNSGPYLAKAMGHPVRTLRRNGALKPPDRGYGPLGLGNGTITTLQFSSTVTTPNEAM